MNPMSSSAKVPLPHGIPSHDKLSNKSAIHMAREHWGIENKVHWVLDIAFREDESRMRKGDSAANFSIVRHIALNMLRHEKSMKLGIKNKRLNAAWNNEYLLKVLGV